MIGDLSTTLLRELWNSGRVKRLRAHVRRGGQEPDPAEQTVLTEIHRLRGQGATLRGIASKLNDQADRTRRGTPWRLESVARVLNAH